MAAQEDHLKQGEKGALVSVVVFLLLAAVKLASGRLFHSSALLADGLNNLTDIVSSTAILIGLRIARKPPDSNHAYGHYRAETIAVLLSSFIMAVVGLQVLLDSFKGLVHKERAAPDPISAAVALGSAVILFAAYIYNRRLAGKIQSQALMATAKDSLSDALVSIGAGVGILGSQIGLPWLDTVAAIAVGLIICKTAWGIFREATHRLTDGFDEQKLKELRHIVTRIPGVHGVKDIKARAHGNQVLVDVVIEVQPDLTVREGHVISDRVEEQLGRENNIMHVHVHVEPALN
ncbi:transporter [Paenibacillus sp. CAA11]|uniref:cation diffusion facilitator family transporter n=1 Tax=Paenibacillus sp. CAA11 TaxID=1532905 RepID=UPI000D3C7AA6|nr:cation diffusion facilitator family transporter [Paenibacillus sp. CAA11]AWB45994.1 transporter [Paenibacillus sp. CAA11]